MGILFKNIHWFIIIYTVWTGYGAYGEKSTEKDELEGRVSAQRTKLKQVTKQRKEIQKYFEDISTSKEQMSKVEGELALAKQRLPDRIDDNKNTKTFSDIANKLNMINATITPSVESNKGFYFEKRYGLLGKGTFLQFLVFIEKIAGLDDLFNIKKVSFKPDNEKNRGRFQILKGEVSIAAYRYNPSKAN